MELDVGDWVQSDKSKHIVQLDTLDGHQERISTFNQEQQDKSQQDPAKYRSSRRYLTRVISNGLINPSLSLKISRQRINRKLIAKHIDNGARLEPNSQRILIQRAWIPKSNPIRSLVIELDCKIARLYGLPIILYLYGLLELGCCHVYDAVEDYVRVELVVLGEGGDLVG